MGQEWENSIIVLGAIESVDEAKQERMLKAARIYAEEFGLSFELDYELVAESENFEVYRSK